MSSGDYIRKSFGERFEPAGPNFLFRATKRSPGVPVSAEERSAMEADLDRRIRRLGLLADGRAQAGAAFAAALVARCSGAPLLIQCAIFLGVFLAISAPMLRLENGVLKRLDGRAPVDDGLTRRQAFLRNAAGKTWSQILSFLLVAFAGVLNMYIQKYDRTSLLVMRSIFTVMGTWAVGYSLAELGAKAWLACDRADRK